MRKAIGYRITLAVAVVSLLSALADEALARGGRGGKEVSREGRDADRAVGRWTEEAVRAEEGRRRWRSPSMYRRANASGWRSMTGGGVRIRYAGAARSSSTFTR